MKLQQEQPSQALGKPIFPPSASPGGQQEAGLTPQASQDHGPDSTGLQLLIPPPSGLRQVAVPQGNQSHLQGLPMGDNYPL